MGVRQYIGARYVVKIYENSLDPSSAEWESGGSYEPLTMVTYLNGSYLSKKIVPSSVGDPASNPDYWIQTGLYNGQIAALQAQIDALHISFNTAYGLFENDTSDTSPAAEVVNSAGQGDTDQRAFVIHNYTDASALRIDHVGGNDMVQLINAHNSTKRPDKASDYHGDADYIKLMIQHDFDEDGTYQQDVIGTTDENGDIFRSGYDNTGDSARNHSFHIATNKLAGGTYAYILEAYNLHDYFMVMRNGGNVMLNMIKDGSKGFKIKGGDQATDPITFGDNIGNVCCLSDGVQVNVGAGNTFRVNLGGTIKQIEYGNNLCTSSTRPTTGLYNGIQYKETDTHKIIWYLNNNWYDAMGNLV